MECIICKTKEDVIEIRENQGICRKCLFRLKELFDEIDFEKAI